MFPWQSVGNIASLNWNSIRNRYPAVTFNKGLVYNGDIQIATDTSWNWGERLALAPSFPMCKDRDAAHPEAASPALTLAPSSVLSTMWLTRY